MRAALDWRSAGLGCTADPAWRRKILRAGFLLMVPGAGWPLVLGWRRLYVERLLDGASPLLPEWRGHHARALRLGLEAMAVIHVWYAPIYLWLGLRTTEWGLWSALPWAPALALALVFPIFSTLLVPAWLLGLRLAGSGVVPPWETLAAAVAFAAVTFAIPGAFLNVACSRRTRSAFDVPRALRWVRAAPRAYVEAWLGSGVQSLVAHLSLPVATWAVVWCYLAIVHAFTELAVPDSAASDSWYRRFAHGHWPGYDVRRAGPLETYRGAGDGAAADSFRALAVGPLRFLLP